MAKLNEEFVLNFHEVDSTITIGFETDEAILNIDDIEEIVPIPVTFEESTSRIPVILADSEETQAIFSDVIIPTFEGYTKAETDALLQAKVDKISGKGLSTNDLTDELVEKIERAQPGKLLGQIVDLYTTVGTLSDEQYEILMDSPLNMIRYQGNIYHIVCRNGNEYTYFTESANLNENSYFSINLINHTWQFHLIENGLLIEHIHNTDMHIQEGERDFWNDKLNCNMNQENLIFTRN